MDVRIAPGCIREAKGEEREVLRVGEYKARAGLGYGQGRGSDVGC